MKKNLITILILLAFIFAGNDLRAGGPPPPPNDHGQNDNQPAGAPIGSGLGILLVMGAAYGGRKVYNTIKDQEKLEE